MDSHKTLAQEIALLIDKNSEYFKINYSTKSNNINSSGKHNIIQNGSNNIFIGKARNIEISQK